MRQLKITKSITNRESASLDKYLQEIGREELISVSEEVELAQRIKKRRPRGARKTHSSKSAICGVGGKAISKSGTQPARPYQRRQSWTYSRGSEI